MMEDNMWMSTGEEQTRACEQTCAHTNTHLALLLSLCLRVGLYGALINIYSEKWQSKILSKTNKIQGKIPFHFEKMYCTQSIRQLLKKTQVTSDSLFYMWTSPQPTQQLVSTAQSPAEQQWKLSPFDTCLEAQQFPSQQRKQKGKKPLWSQGSNHSGRNYGRQLVSYPLWYVLQTPTVRLILKGFAAIWCEFKTLNFTVPQREKQFYNTVHHT